MKYRDMDKKQKQTTIVHLIEYAVYMIVFFVSAGGLLFLTYLEWEFDTEPLIDTDPAVFFLLLGAAFFGIIMMKVSTIEYNITKLGWK